MEKRFDLESFNCWDYVRERWLSLTGRDLGRRTPQVITKEALLGRFRDGAAEFTEIARPEGPCIVLMEQRSAVPHVGVYVRGKVEQLRAGGVSRLPLRAAIAGYQNVRYFRD